MDDGDQGVSRILKEWKLIKGRLDELYCSRSLKETKEWMEKGIELFIQFIMITNDRPFYQGPLQFDQLEIKPVNLEERLAFIKARPNLYHSYRQLSELMHEQEKHFVKKTIKKKSSKPNG
ncbi:YpoC family protein [Neobacillus sp. NRS-1170]|uniref:YpoC family protein n=1 Tax=Neobacillus sp. NRS-1170 TaxID=3233898 RepID=UPI003D29D520